LRAAIPDSADDWCDIDEVVAAGDPGTALTDTAKRLDVDLVVIGASGVPGEGQGLGAVVAHALALPRAHILVVPIPGVLHEQPAPAQEVHV
jgi:nucleotide-binding universal stress UspA family protein